MEFHEAANIFPMMTAEEMAGLVDSIRQGYDSQFPILTYEEKILDGRNRYVACLKAGVEPVYSEWTGSDPVGFVVRANLNRRHLSETQRGIVAGKLTNMPAHRPEYKSANLPTYISQPEAAQMLNVSERTIRTVKAIEREAPELLPKMEAGEMSAHEAAKIVKERKRKEEIAQQREDIETGKANLPEGLFEIIAVDPPWPYGTEYDPDGRRSANPYPEMSLEEIKAIKLPANNDCVLWLWTTHKFMRYSFDLLDAWGFRDVAILTWVKDRMGLGSWLRSQSEFCIMAVKGKPTISLSNQTTVINGAMREHSRKPEEFYQMVDSLCVGRKLDYFSRQEREGWTVFGNDTGRFDE